MTAPTWWSRFVDWIVRCLTALTDSLALAVWDEHGLSYVEPAPVKKSAPVNEPDGCVDPEQESATASGSPPVDLLSLLEEAQLGMRTAPDREWFELIRDAEEVRVQASMYMERGQAYVMPEPDPGRHFDHWPDTSRLLVICHAEDRESVRAIVDKVRGGIL